MSKIWFDCLRTRQTYDSPGEVACNARTDLRAPCRCIGLYCGRLGSRAERDRINGRAIDSAGVGVKAVIMIQSVTGASVPLGHGMSDDSGNFHVQLAALPAKVVLEAIVSGTVAARVELDSTTVRKSNEQPIVIRVKAPHPLAPVRVQARYQKRPSVYNFMESEPSSRVESINPYTTDWFDPLSAGDVAAIFRSAPDMLITGDGSASRLGAPTSANQLEPGRMA